MNIAIPDDLGLLTEPREERVAEHGAMLLTRPGLVHAMVDTELAGMKDPCPSTTEREIEAAGQPRKVVEALLSQLRTVPLASRLLAIRTFRNCGVPIALYRDLTHLPAAIDDRCRSWPLSNQIPEVEYPFNARRADMREHSLQRGQIPMHIRDNGNPLTGPWWSSHSLFPF
ncbi:hypothetical protein GCM10010862_44360 [Devosia nitrariae]|uniref:Uncharacterized protein n=1 Tax=Devosia nitrariae TaxID=2071872 RepID=A0ABQ5WB42_9HYPH|nr:hypothetical protein GCM10010862_44360 [Devosia nitrariae]